VLTELNRILPQGFDAKSIEITFRGQASESSEHRVASSGHP
jgi:hypothetical protein